ncbi:hypothetical protein [Herbaspirillum sp. 1130]|uniref:hypothetical protein n=1 Tax=Herbaspirillum sp. 1130 TaxID=2806562 RepID=UPI001AE42B66|nr:hypothetical protein [Herbaspirillum sp. 1130]MBP1318315.1 hypothetical protein [Herbaspirillum sp. 1130]
MSERRGTAQENLNIDQLRNVISITQKLTEDLGLLCAFFEASASKLAALNLQLLYRDLQSSARQCFPPDIAQIEYRTCLEIIAEIGAVRFIQKLLWSEDVSDMALAIALQEFVPYLDILVEKYPGVLMQNAQGVIDKLSNRN